MKYIFKLLFLFNYLFCIFSVLLPNYCSLVGLLNVLPNHYNLWTIKTDFFFNIVLVNFFKFIKYWIIERFRYNTFKFKFVLILICNNITAIKFIYIFIWFIWRKLFIFTDFSRFIKKMAKPLKRQTENLNSNNGKFVISYCIEIFIQVLYI